MLKVAKRALAKQLDLITSEEAERVLERELKGLRSTAEAALDVQVRERLAIYAENKRLKDELADAREYIEYLKREAYALAPKSEPERITVGDF